MTRSRTYVLDTNVVSRLLKNELQVLKRLYSVKVRRAVVLLCPIVSYEIRRGLMKKGATRQLTFFETWCASHLRWDDLDRPVWDEAATLWAQCQCSGAPRHDNDLLIAAHAKMRNATVVTNNVRHFQDLRVPVEDWQAR